MIEDILTGQKRLFKTGVQSVLRGQENRIRRISIRNGNDQEYQGNLQGTALQRQHGNAEHSCGRCDNIR